MSRMDATQPDAPTAPMSPMSPAQAAELARCYFDSPAPHFSREPVAVACYGTGTALRDRRAAFREVYGAIVAEIGEPTLYGGSAEGPGVRWRTEERLVLLSGDSFGARLSVHRTEDLEGEERRSFEWGGTWSAQESHDFGFLPYLWQLDRGGPGERPEVLPGGRLAPYWDHLQDALELLLTAWAEQLPVQVGEDWATFSILNRADNKRHLSVVLDGDGLGLMLDDREGPDTPEHTVEMQCRGWRTYDRGWWRVTFPDPDGAAAAAAARIVIAEVRARGAAGPEDLEPYDISCNDRGTLRLPGLGLGHPRPGDEQRSGARAWGLSGGPGP